MSLPLLRAVLWDWDGTLLNSAEASYRCYVRLFESFGIAFQRADFERTYSPNWYRTYTAVALPEERWVEADARWLQFYGEEGNQLLPGTVESLSRVEEAGLVQALVTSGDRQRVARELSALGVDSFFETVVCAEDARERKPHPEALLLALDRLGVGATAAAYVGDSPEDVEMARAAGVYAVGIPGGFPNQQALAESTPDLMVSTLPEAAARLIALAAPGPGSG